MHSITCSNNQALARKRSYINARPNIVDAASRTDIERLDAQLRVEEMEASS